MGFVSVIVCGIQPRRDLNDFCFGVGNTVGHVVQNLVCLLNEVTDLIAAREKRIRKTRELDGVQFRRQQLSSQHLFSESIGCGGLEDCPGFPFRIDLCLRISILRGNSKEDG